MSDNSRARVTVTLGRGGGRVVKRAGGVSSDSFSNGVSVSGGKRSIRDRLGGDVDDRGQYHDKRQRGENLSTSSSVDMRLSRGDLRFKLMQKNTVTQSMNDSRSKGDLRDKLSSRNSRPSADSRSMRPPEATTVAARHPMHEPSSAGVSRYPVLEHRGSGILSQPPSSRSMSDMSMLDTGRSRTYPSWTLENLRRRSPERLLRPSAPRGLSPERNREDLLRRTAIRTYDDGRSSMRISPSRPVSSSSFLTRSSLPVAPIKSVAPVPAHYPQASGIIHKIPSTLQGDEPPTVDGLLMALGLDKYAIYFKAEEVDMNALRQMGDNDLKELGIPMGPRKKILQAVMSRSRRHP